MLQKRKKCIIIYFVGAIAHTGRASHLRGKVAGSNPAGSVLLVEIINRKDGQMKGDFNMPMLNMATCSNEDSLMCFVIDRRNSAITEEIKRRILQQGEASEQDNRLIENIAKKLEIMEETDSDLLSMSRRQKRLEREIIGLQNQLLKRMRGIKPKRISA